MIPGRLNYGVFLLLFVLFAGCSDDEGTTSVETPVSPDSIASEMADGAEATGKADGRESSDTAGLDDSVVVSESVKETDEEFKAAYQKRLASGNLKLARIPMRSDGPKSLDPVRGSTVYENQCTSQVIETLLQYKYLKRPFEAEPVLLVKMV